MDDDGLAFYFPFNIIYVILRSWKGDNERLCAMNCRRRLWPELRFQEYSNPWPRYPKSEKLTTRPRWRFTNSQWITTAYNVEHCGLRRLPLTFAFSIRQKAGLWKYDTRHVQLAPIALTTSKQFQFIYPGTKTSQLQLRRVSRLWVISRIEESICYGYPIKTPLMSTYNTFSSRNKKKNKNVIFRVS